MGEGRNQEVLYVVTLERGFKVQRNFIMEERRDLEGHTRKKDELEERQSGMIPPSLFGQTTLSYSAS